MCLQWATDGALKCPRCRPKSKREWVAYVPLYRDIDNKAVFVICHETVKDLLDNLFYGVAVYVGRVEKDASIFVKRSVSEKRYTSTMPTRQAPCDLSETLLNIWGYPQYVEWIQAQERAEKEATEEKKPPRLKPLRSDGHPFGPMTKAAAERYASEPDNSGDVDDAMKGIMSRARDAEKNGHHKRE